VFAACLSADVPCPQPWQLGDRFSFGRVLVALRELLLHDGAVLGLRERPGLEGSLLLLQWSAARAEAHCERGRVEACEPNLVRALSLVAEPHLVRHGGNWSRGSRVRSRSGASIEKNAEVQRLHAAVASGLAPRERSPLDVVRASSRSVSKPPPNA